MPEYWNEAQCDACDIIDVLSDYPLSEEQCITILEIVQDSLLKFNKKLEWEIK